VFNNQNDSSEIMQRKFLAEDIYDTLSLGVIPRIVENDIKWIIYNNISDNIIIHGLAFTEYFNSIMSRAMWFGFKKPQAAEIFVVYWYNHTLISDLFFTCEDLIVANNFGFFSQDISVHLQNIKYTSGVSIMHQENKNNQFFISIKNKLIPFMYQFNEETRNFIITFILWFYNYNNNINPDITFLSNVITDMDNRGRWTEVFTTSSPKINVSVNIAKIIANMCSATTVDMC
jgi:hypothetical protein